MKPKANIMHLPVYQPGKPIEDVKREYGLTEVIKLASNENPFGCSPKAKEAILAETANVSLYPDGAAVSLTSTLSRHLGVAPEQIIFGAGSDDVILMIARAYLHAGDETVMASHTFPQYKHNAEIENAVCIEVPLTEGKHDLPAMLDAVTDKTKIVWICNPNNPTGTIVTMDEVGAFLSKVPSSVMVVLDEAYCEYIDDPSYPNGLALLDKYPNLVVLRTFSKIYGLASLRIGFGVGQPDVIRTINQVREPFNTTRFAQAAAEAAIADQAFIQGCKQKNADGLAYLQSEFKRMGLSYFPAYGNFVMVHVERDAKSVFDGLLSKGIIVRGGHSLGFPSSIRITVGSREQNEKLIEVLSEVLDEVAINV